MEKELPMSIQKIDRISENLELRISKSLDDLTIHLEVRYLKGKFTLNKTVQNSYDGRIELDSIINAYNTEIKIKEYFKLK